LNTGQKGGRLSALVSRFSRQLSRSGDGKRRDDVEPRQVAAVSAETISSSKPLATFLSLLFSQPTAELVDLGPVIGSNITFLGERIGCKIHVADLYADLDRHAHEDALDRFPEFLEGRFALLDESIDAVLCWDIFDYLAPAAANVLAGELMRVLRPGGALLGFFGGGGPDDRRYTKYFIEDEAHLRYRFYAAACTRRQVLQNRDINHLFAGLALFDSVLLKSGVREVLFRKPAKT
jgi:SAM-dependent methyltransferase